MLLIATGLNPSAVASTACKVCMNGNDFVGYGIGQIFGDIDLVIEC